MLQKVLGVSLFVVGIVCAQSNPVFGVQKTKPIISNVEVSVTSSDATINWITNEPCTSKVQYGLTPTYGYTSSRSKTRLTDHSVQLLGLIPDTFYHFRVKSHSASSRSKSGDFKFRTKPPVAKAFPGAVGFGANTPGGRGGSILKVTNLNDSGSGSLRAAIDASGPRIIVFEISGTIQMLSQLNVRNPYLTIAGQTAPSPGITLRAGELNINTHDVIIQHIRIRVGDQVPPGTNPGGLDGISADGINSYGGTGSYNVIMDHISVSWAIDENASSWGDYVHDITFSNCIISEGLNNSLNPKGPHSMGLLVTPNAQHVAIISNLLAHNANRNPVISNGGSAVIANNVLYNWMGGKATNIGNSVSTIPERYATMAYISNNVYIGGPDTPADTYAISSSSVLNTGSKIYYENNFLDHVFSEFRNLAPFNPLTNTPPITIPGYTAADPSTVEASVLTNAGARPADRDAVDVRIVGEVSSRTGKIIDSQSDVGGWPALNSNYRQLTIPGNPNGDDDGNGYTNIEDQLLFPMAKAVEGL
ncbi:MAG: pectate lyase [Acidobacteria bacterium]|nr:MAG: pectate lyase [Acidobacteriota bacterium]